MARNAPPEPVDTRFALRLYAVAVGAAGLSLAAWGPRWLGAHLAELAWGRAALIRLAGAVLVAVAICATGVAQMERHARLRLLSWFIAAHVVVWLMLQVQIAGPLGDVALVRPAGWLLLSVIFGLLYVRLPANAPRLPRRLTSVVDPDDESPDSEALGPYERQIREAGAQEERNRLARDLHDAVKQQIFAIQTSAATAEARLAGDPDGTRDALAQVRQSAREAMAEMEALLDQLRVTPLGNAGLVEATRKQGDALSFRTGARVDVEVGPLPEEDALPPGAHDSIFRIVQEALFNVARHARARHVSVTLASTSVRVEVAVRDDGAGFETSRAATGMGLQNMRVRAREIGGTLHVGPGSAGGTQVTLSVPFETAEARARQRRQELLLTLAVAAAAMALVVDLVKSGPKFSNATLPIFGVLLARHLRNWLRARPVGAAAVDTATGRAG